MRTPFFRNKIFRRASMTGITAEFRECSGALFTCGGCLVDAIAEHKAPNSTDHPLFLCSAVSYIATHPTLTWIPSWIGSWCMLFHPLDSLALSGRGGIRNPSEMRSDCVVRSTECTNEMERFSSLSCISWTELLPIKATLNFAEVSPRRTWEKSRLQMYAKRTN